MVGSSGSFLLSLDQMLEIPPPPEFFMAFMYLHNRHDSSSVPQGNSYSMILRPLESSNISRFSLSELL